MASKVIACELFEYGGRRQELGEGQYFSYKHLGFAPRSLRVPAGLTVHYMLMEGGGGSLDADAARLGRQGNGGAISLLVTDRQARQPVVAYVEANHVGPAVRLDVGAYDVDRLPTGNDRIRSLKIADGHRVVGFEHKSFGGRSVAFTGDVPILGTMEAAISSLRVEKVAAPTDRVTFFGGNDFQGERLELREGNYQRYVHIDLLPLSVRVPGGMMARVEFANGVVWTLGSDARALPYTGGLFGVHFTVSVVDTRASSQVVVYTETDYQGPAARLGAGAFNVDQLPFGDDRIQSMKVVAGCRVVVFEDPNFRGRSATFTGSASNLGSVGGKISSVRVEAIHVPAEVPRVTVYEDPDYGGASRALPVGRHDLAGLGVRNDAISSIRVPDGLVALLFEHAGFAGKSAELTADSPHLGGFNDRTSSVIVAPRSAQAGPCVTVYESRDYLGKSHRLPPGGYDLAKIGLANDTLSSVRVPRGLRVVLYEHAGFGGAKIAYESDTSNVGSFDDKTSSIVVEVVGARHEIVIPPAPKRTKPPAGPPPELVAADDPRLLDLKGLGALPFQLFTRAFALPVELEGDIGVSVVDQAVTFTGRATLTEPFNLGVDAKVRVTRTNTGPEFMARFAMATSLADLLTTKVRPEVSADVWQVLDSTVVPFLEVFDRSAVILSTSDGEDDDLGDYVRGITFYTEVMGDTFEPFRQLSATFPALGLEQRSLVLSLGLRLPGGSGNNTIEAPAGGGATTTPNPGQQGTPTTPNPGQQGAPASPGAEEEEAAPGPGGLSFLLGTELMLNVPLATKAVVFRSVGLQVNQRTTSLSGAATIGFDLHIGTDTLQCRGSLALEGEGAGRATVWGAIDTADGAWKDPFGLRGLMFTGVGLQLSATPNFPYVVIGVRGGVHLGDADIGGDIAVLVDSGNPAASILEVTSPEGIDLPRLAKLYLGPEVVATERVPPVRLKDLRLLAAPLGGTVAGRYFPPGFAIAGRAHLFGFDAQLEGSLDLTQGIVMRGAMDPIRLAPGGFEVFSFTDASGKAGPTVDMQLTMTRQGGTCDGRVRVLGGLVEHKAVARISTTGFEFDVSSDTLLMDYGLKAAFNQGTASFSFAPGLGATIVVAGRTFGLAVRAEVAVQATRWSLAQTVKFRYTLLGRAESLEVRVPNAIRSLDDLLAAFHDNFKRLLLGKLIAELKNVTEAAVKWVRETVGLATRETIKFFKAVGARVEDVATSMLAHLKLSPAAVLHVLEVGVDKGIQVLRDVFRAPAQEALKFAGGFPNMTKDAAEKALKGAGYAANEVEDAFETAGSWIRNVAEDGVDWVKDLFD
jgi:hypothetical protein